LLQLLGYCVESEKKEEKKKDFQGILVSEQQVTRPTRQTRYRNLVMVVRENVRVKPDWQEPKMQMWFSSRNSEIRCAPTA
jgi:hypothetical protein